MHIHILNTLSPKPKYKRSGDSIPHILGLCMGKKWVIIVSLHLLYPQGRKPNRPHSWLGHCGREEIIFTLPEERDKSRFPSP
jgi:hypothetical protein